MLKYAAVAFLLVASLGFCSWIDNETVFVGDCSNYSFSENHTITGHVMEVTGSSIIEDDVIIWEFCEVAAGAVIFLAVFFVLIIAMTEYRRKARQ